MKILLDMGHTISGADTGAEGCGRREQDCTREIGYKVKKKLEALGHTVIICSLDKASSLGQSLSYRVNKANRSGGDLFVSIHLNAFNGNAYGTEVLTYGGKKFKEAEAVLNNLTALGYRNRGIKNGSRLYVINRTNMKSMLIECCFIDNVNDMNKYDPEKISNAIVKGITGEASPSMPSIPDTPASNPSSPSTEKPYEADSEFKSWVKNLQSECNRQRFSNQAVDGIPGPNTLRGCPLLLKGNSGNITKLLQKRLTSLGYSTKGIDGIFGYNTEKAVMEFQKKKYLSSDGIVGRNTWKKLLNM